MLTIETFTFNPYQENTYLIIDDSNNHCIIVDPGMHTVQEQNYFKEHLDKGNLTPVLLLNTHCHIDHVLGNRFVFDNWGIVPNFHEAEVPVLVSVENYAPQMGFRYETSPIPESFLEDKETISFGDHHIESILAPGHSPGHLCFYLEEIKSLIGGDVLFRNSIGRSDLPGGDHQTLLKSISTRIYTLPEDTEVFPGHGSTTTIGFEKQTNPFIRG
ncbi:MULTISPECIES: MBL fold metallo-hydrolase [Sphingobacterium]|uniref:MBL fold metallo-hydrolase n=1 Tax=Sphingobacterium litopenaei TaxID=2763500 RepID=A0ABR7YHT0_9SPHI|nr:MULTISPECIES: MBL fold metallo-hydrolase [Sphingobacterium]MBD1430821.1 MBL fold metallo-hydrolase [Sphingobacterium litopenaei]NGM74693.1 MBL fold metallo-hydrolase [Sphingobacterium sp. SGL-16]